MTAKQLAQKLLSLLDLPTFFTPENANESHAISGIIADGCEIITLDCLFRIFCNDANDAIKAHTLARILMAIESEIVGPEFTSIADAHLIDETKNANDSWIDIYT